MQRSAAIGHGVEHGPGQMDVDMLERAGPLKATPNLDARWDVAARALLRGTSFVLAQKNVGITQKNDKARMIGNVVATGLGAAAHAPRVDSHPVQSQASDLTQGLEPLNMRLHARVKRHTTNLAR